MSTTIATDPHTPCPPCERSMAVRGRQYAGNHGNCWSDVRSAYQFPGEYHIDEAGVARWDSNGSALMVDSMLVRFEFDIDTICRTAEARKAEDAEFLRKYREAQANVEPSAEELAEMRAAFGEGEVVVNVLTGRKVYL